MYAHFDMLGAVLIFCTNNQTEHQWTALGFPLIQ